MGSAQARPYDNEIKLGAPQVFALKFTTGKAVASRFPGGRAMFTAIDERKIFLNDEETSEFEHELLDKRIQPGEFICVSRVTHGRGGGHAIRVERVDEREEPGTLAVPAASRPAPPAPMWPPRTSQPSREEALLEKSVEMARDRGPAAFVTATAEQPIAVTPAAARWRHDVCSGRFDGRDEGLRAAPRHRSHLFLGGRARGCADHLHPEFQGRRAVRFARHISPKELAAKGWKRAHGYRTFVHQDGWRISHCCHPTALWPYLLVDPAGRVILTGAAVSGRADFGTAWPSIASAVEYVARGRSRADAAGAQELGL